MEHAEHFLARLVRLADDEVKLALALYHDSEWVREVLRASELPEAAPRVALSLADRQDGPFVVVTREGDFVTCLGRGMHPGKLPVLARERLDVSASKLGRERERERLHQRLSHGDRSLRALLRRLFFEADNVSREDFQQVAAWEPLLGPLFLDNYLAMGGQLAEQGLVLRRKRLARRASDEVLRDYWNLLHATGHLALLGAGTADRAGYDSLTAGDLKSRAAFSYALTGTGVSTFMLKGAWAAGRMGKPMLAAYKRALAEDVALFELFDTLLALLVLGRRSTKLRAEIVKAVAAAPDRAESPQPQVLRAELGREIGLVCALTVDLLESPRDQLDQMLERLGRTYLEPAMELDEPELHDIARTLPLMSWSDGITDGKRLTSTFHLAAIASELDAERFYLPRAALGEFRRPWQPDHTWKMLEPSMRVASNRGPARQEAVQPGRNEACPCQSGKKYKRCCAR